MHTYDTIVIGSGVIGSAAAMHLALRGRTLLLERFSFLHDQGSSHGGSRIFRHAYEDAMHVRLAVVADAAWLALEEETGERLLFRTGGLDIGDAGSLDLRVVKSALDAVGRAPELLTGHEVSARFPAFALGEEHEAVYQADAGVLAAGRAVATMQRRAAAEGAVLRDQEAVVKLEPKVDGVDVITTLGRYSAGRVVVAAGGWLSKLVSLAGVSLRVQLQQYSYLRTGADARRFAMSQMPVFIDRRGNANGETYGLPVFEVPNAVKVGDHSGVPAPRNGIDPDDKRLGVDDAWAGRTVASALALMPHLAGGAVASMTCLYTHTPDGRFVVDRLQQYPNVIVAGGGSGHAFKFGPVLGEAVADLATVGRSRHDLTAFSLSRFAPTQLDRAGS
ncbi:MAG TPA: N-methyl-L-tryptophan oxidase [Trueperaceae bacterium]|nr:N-methyl-L-tryptophan oxidase [Trueperaceae bacterium]